MLTNLIQSFKYYKWLIAILAITLIPSLALSACGSNDSSEASPTLTIAGKWEQVSGEENEIGTLMEFFEDGTVSINGQSAEYTWPDEEHLKIEYDFGYSYGVVYEATLSSDELILKKNNSISQNVFRRYKELDVNKEAITGTWIAPSEAIMEGFHRNKGCLATDSTRGGLKNPTIMVFGTTGDFAGEWPSAAIGGPNWAMNGQYSLQGHGLHIQIAAAGVKTEPLEQVSGSAKCEIVAVSQSRLLFKDDQGITNLYVKKN